MEKFENASVFIYALTETELLRKTVDVLLETCRHEDLREIVIVVSEKATTEECLRTAYSIAEKPCDVEIKVFFQKRKGLGGAMLDSFDIMRGSHYIDMEADFGTDPYAVSKFIERAKIHPEKIITASRWIKGGKFEGYGKIKMAVNFVFQKIISVMYSSNLTDYSHSYQIMPADVVKSIKWDEPRREFIIEMTLKPLRAGIEFEEVPVHWKKRSEGKSTQSFIKNFSYFIEAVKIRFMDKASIISERD